MTDVFISYAREDRRFVQRTFALTSGRVIDGRRGRDERNNIAPFPDDLAAWFGDHPNLDATRLDPTTVGGVDGATVQTHLKSSPDTAKPWPVCGVCVEVIASTIDHELGPFTTDDLINVLGPGEFDRRIVLHVDGSTILIDFFSATRSDLEAFEPAVREVLDTVRFAAT